MAYITQLNGALITLDLNGLPVITVPPTSVLNDFGTSSEVTGFNVQDDGNPGTVSSGEFLAAETEGGTIRGAFAGNATIENAGLSLGSPTGGFLSPNLGISVSVNPISGQYVAGEDGNAYFISEDPLSANRIMATLTVKLPGLAATTVSLPVSELSSRLATLDPTGLLNTLLGGSLDLTQRIVDTAILTSNVTGGSLTLPEYDIVCFVRGTELETSHGRVKIEDLTAGMSVMTRDNGPQEIKWIGSTKVKLSVGSKLTPICIKANALGEKTPSADLYVSPEHRVLVRSRIARKLFGADEVLVAAKQLLQLNGIDIAVGMTEVEYFHVLFDQHEIVVSNGAETESLYTGPVAMRSVSKAAAEEIYSLFPELRDADYISEPARQLLSGHAGRKLAVRHLQHGCALVM